MNTAADVAIGAAMGDKTAQSMARAARACGMAYRYAGRAGVRLGDVDAIYSAAKARGGYGGAEHWAQQAEWWAMMAAMDARRIRRARRRGLPTADDMELLLEAVRGATRADGYAHGKDTK